MIYSQAEPAMRDLTGSSTRAKILLALREGPAAIDIPIAFLSPVIAGMIGIFILYFSKQRPNLQYDLLIDGWMIWIYMLLYAI